MDIFKPLEVRSYAVPTVRARPFDNIIRINYTQL